MLNALERIGAKAELRQHRMESARRSVSRPQMEAVRGSAPAPARTGTAPSPAAGAAPPNAGAPAPAPAPAAPATTGDHGSAPSTQPVELPLGTPVAGELSKTPRIVFLVIVGVLALVTLIAVAMSFVGGSDAEELLPIDTEAMEMADGASMDVRAYLNNPRAGFSGSERSDITPFVDACYAAGAARLVVADIDDLGGGTKFAHALLVELPESESGVEAIRTAEQDILGDSASDVDFGNRWLVVRFNR
jgi:hypothetical protein